MATLNYNKNTTLCPDCSHGRVAGHARRGDASRLVSPPASAAHHPAHRTTRTARLGRGMGRAEVTVRSFATDVYK